MSDPNSIREQYEQKFGVDGKVDWDEPSAWQDYAEYLEDCIDKGMFG